jgi:hypothetical protein
MRFVILPLAIIGREWQFSNKGGYGRARSGTCRKFQLGRKRAIYELRVHTVGAELSADGF